jgi:hypothetical protein
MTLTAQMIDPASTLGVFSAEQAAAGSEAPALIGGVLDAVVQFTQIDTYTTFNVEYALVGEHIVIHFFPPKEAYVSRPGGGKRVSEEYLIRWQRHFPAVLSPVAEQHFNATLPVISATYVAEMTSWYMRCAGFANRFGPDEMVLGFFEKLDKALDAA